MTDDGECRRTAHGVGVVSAAVHDGRGTKQLHHLAATGETTDGEAVPHRLCENRQVGRHAEARLGAAERDAKTGDHLVEDQQYVVLRAELAHAGEIAGRRGDHGGVAHDRLHDDRGDFWIALQPCAQEVEIVPGQDDLTAIGRLVLALTLGHGMGAASGPRRPSSGRTLT